MVTPRTPRRPHVLLVNDDADVLDMYQVGLTLYGFEASTAAPTSDALQERRRIAPDLVVADVPLLAAGAWDLVAQLKGQPPDQPVPVVLLTGDPDPAIQGRAYQLGCAAVLLKPCAPDELAAVARQLLAIRPAMRNL